MLRAICLALATTVATLVSASTFTVLTNNDSGPGSLRSGVNSGADTIVFHPSVTTITLTSGPLVPVADLVVAGPGRFDLWLSGGGTQRLFVVEDVALSVSGMSLANGFTTGLFTDPGGGAVYATSADLHFFDCQFRNNEAILGGAIYAEAGCTLWVDSCFFFANVAESTGGSIGSGALNNHIRLERTAFEDGIADEGAALDLGNGELLIDKCLFEGNVSLTSIGAGGAVVIGSGGSLTKRIWHSTFFGNTAYRGAGLSITSSGPVELLGNTIMRNTGERGSGLFIGVDELTLANNVISNNEGGPDLFALDSTGSSGWNFIGYTEGPFHAGAADQIGSDSLPLDANPGLLGPNGGPVRLVPIACAPTVNAGNPAFAPYGTDARGEPRSALGGPDLGAFELQRDDVTATDPIALAGFTGAVLSWSGSLGPDKWQVAVQALDGSETILDESVSTAISIFPLQPGTAYRWKARAACDDGQIGPPSVPDTFMTSPLPRWAGNHPALQVFPNPTRDAWQLPIDQPGPVTVLDASGRVVRNLDAPEPGTLRIDAADLAPGTYRIVTAGGSLGAMRVE